MSKAFQIYIGQPSEAELKCMERTKSLFDEYTLFSFGEYLDYTDGFIIFGNNNKSVFKLILEGIYGMVKDGKKLNIAPYQCVKKQPNKIPKMYFN